jgi:hypothetical protein
MSEIGHDYYDSPHERYENDHRQMVLMFALLTFAAIGSVLLILKALL